MNIKHINIIAKTHTKNELKLNTYNIVRLELIYDNDETETITMPEKYGYGTAYLERVIEFLNEKKGYNMKYLTDIRKQSFTVNEQVSDVTINDFNL